MVIASDYSTRSRRFFSKNTIVYTCQGEHCCRATSGLFPWMWPFKIRNENDDSLFSEAEPHKPAAGLQIRFSSELKVMFSKAAPSLLNSCWSWWAKAGEIAKTVIACGFFQCFFQWKSTMASTMCLWSSLCLCSSYLPVCLLTLICGKLVCTLVELKISFFQRTSVMILYKYWNGCKPFIDGL